MEEKGYLVLRGVLGAAALESLREAFRETCDLAPGSPFLPLLREDRVLDVVEGELGRPFRLLQIGGREPRRGRGLQALHADWPPRAAGSRPFGVTTIWMLDDFREENGSTRVVPGSHRLPGPPPKRFADPAARHPQEAIVTGAAGDVLAFDGSLWHGGTRNRSGERRRALQLIFGTPDAPWHGATSDLLLPRTAPALR